MEVHRGEVYYADLSPVVGSEQGGVRLIPEERVIDAYLRFPGETLGHVDESAR